MWCHMVTMALRGLSLYRDTYLLLQFANTDFKLIAQKGLIWTLWCPVARTGWAVKLRIGKSHPTFNPSYLTLY